LECSEYQEVAEGSESDADTPICDFNAHDASIWNGPEVVATRFAVNGNKTRKLSRLACVPRNLFYYLGIASRPEGSKLHPQRPALEISRGSGLISCRGYTR
jgi:hypothetical protein